MNWLKEIGFVKKPNLKAMKSLEKAIEGNVDAFPCMQRHLEGVRMDILEYEEALKVRQAEEQENKSKALECIIAAMKSTKKGSDELISAEYNTDREDVTFVFKTGGTQVINVYADSELCFIEEVVKYLLKMLY